MRVDYSEIGAHEVAKFADAILGVADVNGDGVIDKLEFVSSALWFECKHACASTSSLELGLGVGVG